MKKKVLSLLMVVAMVGVMTGCSITDTVSSDITGSGKSVEMDLGMVNSKSAVNVTE